ncbi:MAG: hypothetical protein GEU80_09355 [Dehalococcoidia bacterium]|nr:hypothetical protein [Dehalococcoidia bacterium]
MHEALERLRQLRDPHLTAFEVLLGDNAVEVLAAALAPASMQVAAARPAQVTWRPGRSLGVRYEARVRRAGSRRLRNESLVAWTGTSIPSGATVVESGEARVAVWRLADDPALPGLRGMLDERSARRMLDSVDVPPGRIGLQFRAYRPLSRAVVEVGVGGGRLFAKVVRPDRVADLQRRHRIMQEQLPVPRSHGWSAPHGLVLLEGMPGETLRASLLSGRGALPAPDELRALLDRIPDPQDGAHASARYAVDDHGPMLALLLPELASRIDALRDAITVPAPEQQLVPVHGDFHPAQLLTQDGAICALLDVDTVALGSRAGDWASMLAHLAVVGESLPAEGAARVAAYTRGVRAVAESEVDPADLQRRIADVTVGLATGPFRVQTPDWPEETRQRIALAERHLEGIAGR